MTDHELHLKRGMKSAKPTLAEVREAIYSGEIGVIKSLVASGAISKSNLSKLLSDAAMANRGEIVRRFLEGLLRARDLPRT